MLPAPSVLITGLLSVLMSLPLMAQSAPPSSREGGESMTEEQLRQQQRAASRQSPGQQPRRDELEEGVPVLEAYGDGDEALHLLVGLGGRIENGMGYFYLSHFETLDRPSSSSRSFQATLPPDNEYRSTRFGFHAEGHTLDTCEGFGLGLFLYRNRADVEIDRSGLGGTLDLAYVMADRVRFYVGADLMPGFTSFQANDEASLLEYEWHGGVRVLIGQHVDLGVVWRNGRTWDTDRRTELFENVMAGLRVSF